MFGMRTFEDCPDGIHDGRRMHGPGGVAGVAEDELLVKEGGEGGRER